MRTDPGAWLAGLFLAALACTTPLCAATLELAGSVGKAAVVMHLEVATDGSVQGRYFYRAHHRDIVLSGRVQEDGALALSENAAWSGPEHVDLQLQAGESGHWAGQWLARQGAKRLPVQLAPLVVAAPAMVAGAPWPPLSPYDAARLQDLPYQREASGLAAGRHLQWWREPYSGLRMFRLQDGYAAPVLAQLNALLARTQDQAVNQFFQCRRGVDENFGPKEEAEFAFTPTLRLASAALLSVSVDMGGSCGGHVNSVLDFVLNISPATMQALALDDVLAPVARAALPPPTPAGELPNPDYRSTVLAPWLAAEMTRRYPAQVRELQDRCQFEPVEIWRFPDWYATPDGLYLVPRFPRNGQAPCGGDLWLLPWSVVKAHPGRLQLSLP